MDARLGWHKFGEKRRRGEKCCYGCFVAFILILVLLLPILIFSNINPAVELNNLQQVSLNIEMRVTCFGRSMQQTIYRKQSLGVFPLEQEEFDGLKQKFKGIEGSWQPQMQKIEVDPNSDTEWLITMPNLVQLRHCLQNPNSKVEFIAFWKLRRPKPEDKQVVSGSITSESDKETKAKLYKLVVQYLANTKGPSIQYMNIPNILPDFIYVGSKNTISVRKLTYNGPMYS